MRFALPLLAALVLITLVACGGEDDAEPAEPVALAQRVLTAEDAPGSKPDPVETRQTTVDFDEFIDALTNLAIGPDTDELTDVFTDAGFEGAILDTRFTARRTPGARLTSRRRSSSSNPSKGRRTPSNGSSPTT